MQIDDSTAISLTILKQMIIKDIKNWLNTRSLALNHYIIIK